MTYGKQFYEESWRKVDHERNRRSAAEGPAWVPDPRVAHGIPQKRHDPGCEGDPCSCAPREDFTAYSTDEQLAACRPSAEFNQAFLDAFPVEGSSKTCLERAEAAVSGPRQEAYGPPSVNHNRTAALWAAYLHAAKGVDVGISAEDVAWFNVLQKMSREMHSATDDGLVDVAGYVRNIEMLRGES